ncbi:WXG100 family type VII secretion target [Lentzea sp. BCCO 10_0798]|uniref:ESAT-6-like protein n=1 Tax=Lentzea kristufekii TaxID=3095430 RepID=A0ABU4U6R3_9PSEU|nr:WXG100 family type VII secretion target [Lentzea sp. BCCO 10_0798]MDX8056147.1 WXG100 family type VII secretion target [Lentzea sp. BCCO 10_0798]
MAGNNTTLTPAEIESCAQRHRTTSSSVTSQLTTVSGQISALSGSNKGAMINKLITVHQDWDSSMKKVVTNLDEMASTLSKAGRTLQTQDETNAGNTSV